MNLKSNLDIGDKFHLSKRARHDKTSVVVFDDADRKEYLSGFRKRKNKRRQVAAEQLAAKERQIRLRERKERRQALKEEMGDLVREDGKEGEEDDDGDTSEELFKPTPVESTVTYDEIETTTVVNVTILNPETEESQDQGEVSALGDERSRAPGHVSGKPKKRKLKLKIKKQPREKRIRKLTKREKSSSNGSRGKKARRK